METETYSLFLSVWQLQYVFLIGSNKRKTSWLWLQLFFLDVTDKWPRNIGSRDHTSFRWSLFVLQKPCFTSIHDGFVMPSSQLVSPHTYYIHEAKAIQSPRAPTKHFQSPEKYVFICVAPVSHCSRRTVSKDRNCFSFFLASSSEFTRLHRCWGFI